MASIMVMPSVTGNPAVIFWPFHAGGWLFEAALASVNVVFSTMRLA